MMSKYLRLLMVSLLAVLLLAACGAPAHVNEAAHDEAAAADQAEADDAAAVDEPADSEAAAEDDAEAAADEEAAAPDDAAHGHAEAEAGDMEVDGDAANGEELFTTLYTEVGFACATCHHVDSEDRLIGPGLLNIKIHGAGHVEGLTLVEYLHQSIVEPNAYIVPDYPENLMPQTYSELFTEDQINDIIAYLLTLEG